MKHLTTEQAARRLGVQAQAIRAAIARGRLPALKMGRDWLVLESDLDAYATRKPGRPRKS